MKFSMAVPTSTLIGVHPDNPFLVCVIEQAKKHRKRMTLVGGRLRLPRQTHLTCLVDEFDEEAGGAGATLTDIRLWAIKTDPYSDVREVTLGKLTHETCDSFLSGVPVIGHYGAPDHIYLAKVIGTPFPKDGEAKECKFFDVRDLSCTNNEEESCFGAQHDLILIVYRLFLEGRPVEIDDFTDFQKLRAKLLAILEQES
jgi:hypothetical protein